MGLRAVSIRARLALWYSAVLTLVLVVFGVALYLAVGQHLSAEVDATLVGVAQHVANSPGTVVGAPERPRLPELDAFAAPGVHLQLLDARGQVVAHSSSLGLQALPRDEAALARAVAGEAVAYTQPLGPNRVRVYNLPALSRGQVVAVIQAGKSFHDRDQAMARLAPLLAGGIGLVVLLATAIGFVIAGSALRPIAEVTRLARAISLSRSLRRRLPAGHPGDEVGELSRAFNEMLASLEQAYELQRRFVADASHELRTPLTTVQGNLELLARPDLPEGDRAAITADVRSEVGRLSRLVADLLALARADAGQGLTLAPTELDPIVLEAYQRARRQAEARALKLRLEAIDQVVVRGDADRLRQLLLILLDNAIRYTLRGEVRLRLDREERRPPGGGSDQPAPLARLTIADTGVGIGREELARIFERFYRGERARSLEPSGSGLGLAIARWIVDQHRGWIAVASRPGEGTVLTVYLPLAD